MITRGLLLACVLVGTLNAMADEVPRKPRKLFAWLQAATYRTTFTGEPAVRASAIHGPQVRVWYSPELVRALADGAVSFPKRAAMVKELYAADGVTVAGYSVMAKVRRRSGRNGEGWFWFETLNGVSTDFLGRGVRLCSGCHVQGTDFLQSPFRP